MPEKMLILDYMKGVEDVANEAGDGNSAALVSRIRSDMEKVPTRHFERHRAKMLERLEAAVNKLNEPSAPAQSVAGAKVDESADTADEATVHAPGDQEGPPVGPPVKGSGGAVKPAPGTIVAKNVKKGPLSKKAFDAIMKLTGGQPFHITNQGEAVVVGAPAEPFPTNAPQG